MSNVDPGLCRSCEHHRVLQSARGSSFYFCQLHNSDPRFAKYPRLPVRQCDGYSAQPHEDEPEPGKPSGR